MTRRKILILGASSVGKSSLVRRFARSIYSPRYLTTVGVEVHRTAVDLDGTSAELVVWDLAGEDEFHNVQTCHLRGAASYLLVVDGTRPATLVAAFDLQRRVELALGPVPFIAVLNKADLSTRWAIDADLRSALDLRGWQVATTSARTGLGVREVFTNVARLAQAPPPRTPTWTSC